MTFVQAEEYVYYSICQFDSYKNHDIK